LRDRFVTVTLFDGGQSAPCVRPLLAELHEQAPRSAAIARDQTIKTGSWLLIVVDVACIATPDVVIRPSSMVDDRSVRPEAERTAVLAIWFSVMIRDLLEARGAGAASADGHRR
jgi:hypothetical protein